MLGKLWHGLTRIFGIMFILLVLSIIGLIVFILTFDLNHYKDFAAAKLTLILNRPVTIESMHTKLALIPTITITGFQVLNDEPFQDKAPLLSVQKMDAELELAPLLNSQLNIHKVDVEAATINLFKTKTANNWVIRKKTEESDAQPTNPKKVMPPKKELQNNIRLNTITIGSLGINYDNSGAKQSIKFNKLEMKHLHMISGELAYKRQTITFNLNTGTIFDLMNQTPDFPIDLKIQSRLANFTLNGKIGSFEDFSGLQAVASMRTNNIRNAMDFLGIKSPFIPTQNAQLQFQLMGDLDDLTIKQSSFNINSDKDLIVTGTGTLRNVSKNPTLSMEIKAQLMDNKLVDLWHVQPMSLSGDITISPLTFKTKALVLDAKRSDARLAADVVFKNNKFNISSTLTSNFLNIHDFIKEDTEAPAEKGQKNNESATTSDIIPWDQLTKFNLNLNVDVKHLQASNLLTDYIGIVSHSSLNDGILRMPFDINALSGKVNGLLNANARSQTVALTLKGINLNLNGIRYLNQDLQNVVLQTNATLNTKGANTQELLQNLNGKIVAETAQGQITNKWFAALPKALSLNKKKSNVSFNNTESRVLITCAAANLNLKNGVISGKNQIALETNAISMLSGGSINLPQQTMDITIRPSLQNNTADDWLSLSKYIRIVGPFNKLTSEVDSEQVAMDLIQAGVNKLMGAEATSSKTVVPLGSMCQTVLGKDAIKQPKAKTPPTPVSSPVPQAQQPQPEKEQPQNQPFKKQLLDSLFQVLTPQ